MMQQHQLNAMQQQQQQLQQQQSGQQQQDSSQQPHPGMPGFSDQQRIWSQMQHMQQMRNQNGQDMNTPSSQQQASNFFNIFVLPASTIFVCALDGFSLSAFSAHTHAKHNDVELLSPITCMV